MNRPRRHPKKPPLIDSSGTRKTVDILHRANAGLHWIQDRIDDEEENAAHEAEVRRCRYDAIMLPYHDPRRTAAHERMHYLNSADYQAWRKVRLIQKKLWRRARGAVFLAFMIPLQILLIVVVFNVVGFLLLMWIPFGF